MSDDEFNFSIDLPRSQQRCQLKARASHIWGELYNPDTDKYIRVRWDDPRLLAQEAEEEARFERAALEREKELEVERALRGDPLSMSLTQRLSRPLPASAGPADDDDGIVKAMRPVPVTQKQQDRMNLPTDALVEEAQEAKTVRLSKEQRNGMDAMFIVLRRIMCIWCIENDVTYTRAKSEFCNANVVRADTAWNLYQQTAEAEELRSEAKKALARTAVERREHGSVVARSKTKTSNVQSNSVGKSSAREDLDSDEEEEDDKEDGDTRSDGRQEGTEDGDEQDDDEQDGQGSNQGQLDRLGREEEGNDGDDDQPHFIRRAYKARQDDWREKNGLDPNKTDLPGFLESIDALPKKGDSTSDANNNEKLQRKSRLHDVNVFKDTVQRRMNQLEDKHQVSCFVFIASAHRQDERVQEIVRSQVAAAFLRSQKSVRPLPFLGEFASFLEGNKMARGDWASGARLEPMPSDLNVEKRRDHIQKTLTKQYSEVRSAAYRILHPMSTRQPSEQKTISWMCLEKHGVEVLTGSVGADLLRGLDSDGKRIKWSKEQCRVVWDEMDKGLIKFKVKNGLRAVKRGATDQGGRDAGGKRGKTVDREGPERDGGANQEGGEEGGVGEGGSGGGPGASASGTL
ncbi:hypothetical protein L198_03231 [Cryptococcus wingfieldii CBS 7118]|uniref:Uncharacterized protein n=1 Tax=Cryptococcus wingfieldii CBS 7118 TaxID=1295528 RepID=A0A1E3JEU1_9TREE|nr:hypothetical protein L198_03231 [Cryptococcus wingfieldii CBS 7118]ODN99389.1 hypothetical protein L198_03231 [Cryptococcus wingfieldii CBS 7118]